MSTAQLQACEKAMNKVKVQLMEDTRVVFMTTVFFSLRQQWDYQHQTAATDGRHVWFNPDFFMSLTRGEQLFLVLHETMHAALMHMTRLNGRNPKKWNRAADYVINYILVSQGFTMPQGGLYDPQYKDMSTEQVYNLLPDSDEDDVDLDLVEPEDADEEAEISQEMDEILVRAATQAQMANSPAGMMPGEVARRLNELVNPELPWRQIFAKYVNTITKSGYSFRRPNRRFFPNHIIPSLYSKQLGRFAVALDVSGSVSDERFTKCVSEMYPVLTQLRPKEMTMVQFDYEVKDVDKIRSVNDLRRVQFTGYGGTLIHPVMQWAIHNKPEILVIFTDGYFTPPRDKPKCPVIWLVYENPAFEAPFGKVVHIK